MKLKITSISPSLVVAVLQPAEGDEHSLAQSARLKLRDPHPEFLASVKVGQELGFDVWPIPTAAGPEAQIAEAKHRVVGIEARAAKRALRVAAKPPTPEDPEESGPEDPEESEESGAGGDHPFLPSLPMVTDETLPPGTVVAVGKDIEHSAVLVDAAQGEADIAEATYPDGEPA